MHYQGLPMKTWSQNLLFAIAALSAVNLLISCVPKGGSMDHEQNSSPAAPAQTSSGSPAGGSSGNSPHSPQGTSDSGGGTGFDGKVFESFIVDPLELPAYKQYLDSLLKNITAAKGQKPTRYSMFFELKTWYIAPVELDKIKKDVLGISFINSATQQIARQTSTEVWIDKKIYDDQMKSEEERAKLLLHELVMNMYLIKFMSYNDICRVEETSRQVTPEERDSCKPSATHDAFNDSLPPEKPHPLGDEDNANIRFVTGWLWRNAKVPIAETEFIRILASKGFDRRFFKPANYGDKTAKVADLKITRLELFRAIAGAKLTGNMPNICTGISSGKAQECQFDVAHSTIEYSNTKFPAFIFSLKTAGAESIEINSLEGTDDVSLGASEDSDGRVFYTYMFFDWRSLIRIGDRSYFGLLMFSKDVAYENAPLILESIILKPGVIVSTNKVKAPFCTLRSPNVDKFTDDGLIIRRKGNGSTMLERMYSMTPPMAACSPDNVAE
jgi:hypothetical protein